MNHLIRGGEFLIKESDPSSIYIPEDKSEEDKLIMEMCRQFLEAEVYPNLDKIDDHKDNIMVALLDKAGEQGLLGTSIPEEYGGYGKDFNTNAFVAEVLGAGHSFPVSLMAHTGIGTLPILYFGTEEQKKKYLPGLASGKLKACYCLTEPGSGSDALAASTKAVLSEDGSHYTLSGQKIWITNAGFADIFIVFAKAEGRSASGFTGFIVERGMKGLTVGEEERKMGIKGSSTAQVFFEDCEVPVGNVLGEVGKGHLIAFNILNIGRFKLCAATVGSAKRVADISVAYANQRMQFKQPISSFGAIKHKLAEQAVKIFACESALYRTSDYIQDKGTELREGGKSYGESLMLSAKEYAVECAILKVYGSEMLDFVIDEGLQIHGGYGFSEEYPMARFYRDSRINRIFEGTNEINRLLIVDMLVKSAMKGELDLMGAAKEVQKELLSIPQSGSGSGVFGWEQEAVAGMKKAVLITAGAAARKLMMALEKEQEVLMNIADMIIMAYVAESALLRCMKTGKKETTDLLQVFVADAAESVASSAHEAAVAFAEGDELRMLLAGIKRFTKFPPFNTKEARRRIAGKMIAEGKYCW